MIFDNLTSKILYQTHMYAWIHCSKQLLFLLLCLQLEYVQAVMYFTNFKRLLKIFTI